MSRDSRLAAKRLMDVVGSALLLIPGLPIMAAVALAIRLESHGPILFRQEREGRQGRPFRIHKFRSMVKDADRHGPVTSMADPLVTHVGRVVRRFSLDELPQLFHVLVGEMSLVGPRPLLPGTTRPEERRRLDMRPGMTSLVEVRRPHLLSWDERMRIDVEYVETWSLALDLSILMRTIPAVLTRKDILDAPRS
jgi:lipopolysaccharide/colanic/teichoic acid biosynthesis glycosyltransferase